LAAQEVRVWPRRKVGKDPWSGDGAEVWQAGLVLPAEKKKKNFNCPILGASQLSPQI